jgi:hypothetical protein
VALSVTSFAILAWHTRQGKPTLATAVRRAELSAAAVHLDSQAASILASLRTHLNAGERYSVSLAQVGKSLDAGKRRRDCHHRQVSPRRKRQDSA